MASLKFNSYNGEPIEYDESLRDNNSPAFKMWEGILKPEVRIQIQLGSICFCE